MIGACAAHDATTLVWLAILELLQILDPVKALNQPFSQNNGHLPVPTGTAIRWGRVTRFYISYPTDRCGLSPLRLLCARVGETRGDTSRQSKHYPQRFGSQHNPKELARRLNVETSAEPQVEKLRP